jgi:hypothetical protein
MRTGSSHFVIVLIGAILCMSPAAHAQIWKKFVPSSRGSEAQASNTNPGFASDSPRANSQDAQPQEFGAIGDFPLKQESGPWLIVAASFSGNGAEKQAHDLAQELRDRFRLNAYIHQMDFKLDDNAGPQSPTRRHYRRGDEVKEIAVLIGDFQSIDGPDAQQMLSKVKSLEPNALNVDARETAQSMAQMRKFEDAFMEKFGDKSRKRGPMAQAFFTRNPLLPREYFVPKGVDAFVAKMNEGVEHSLLDCPGRQTIQVATFRGKTILQTNAVEDPATKSLWGLHKKDDHNPLIEAAENAHLLTKALRAHGYDAYEFHDRTESIVTIGSYAKATQQLPDGRTVAIPEVQRIIQTFDASFDTPADPLSRIGNDSRTQQAVHEKEQQMSLKLNSQQAQVVPGMNPKHVKILKGHGRNVTVERIIPIDVHPQVIDVPKRSVSSAYAN